MRLLLVEDDQALVQRLQTALTQAGYAVDVASDGITGEELGNTELYDVVVLDLGLPQRSGLDVLRNWRVAGNPVPVIILTARDAWHERVDGFQAGADDYLGKPFSVEELGPPAWAPSSAGVPPPLQVDRCVRATSPSMRPVRTSPRQMARPSL